MGEYSLIGTYLLAFIAFSVMMYQQNKIIRQQRKMLFDDVDVIGRAHASLCRIIDISCMIFEDPDKYQKEIKKIKDSRDELRAYAEELNKEKSN